MNTLPFPGSGDDPVQPRRIGRYEILGRIGHGSMGVVYLAQDPLIGRRVALKTFSRRQAPGSSEIGALRDQLLNEAVSAGGLNHPGIVTIHDVVEDEEAGQVGVAMEYVAGRTLKEILDSPDIVSLNFTAGVIQRVAEVLDFAHGRGVVHRDIKPANVILSEDQGLKVADFGIASLRGRDLAQDLKAMGTPNYLAPERLLGHEADHRADIYSLGVLLYEMLTGHVPFQGESLAELARNTVEEDFTPPEIYRPDLLPGLRAILDRALAKDPEERYQSAGDLASDLAAVVKAQARMSDTRPVEGVLLEGRAAAGPRPGAARRAWRRLARAAAAMPRPPIHLSRVAASSALGLAILLSAAVLIWHANRPGRVPSATTAAPVDPAGAKEELRQLEYLSLLRRVQEHYEAGRTEEAERLLAEAETLAPEAERIRQLRAEAYFNVEADRAVRRVAQTLQLLEAAEEAVDRGSFGTADAALYKIFEIDPDNEEARALARRLEAAREAVRRAQRQRLDAEAAAELAAREAQPRFEPFTVTEVPQVPEPEPFGTLKVDFRSEQPKGVLTVYAGTEQILRREYSFYEKRGLFRRRATTGGFDMQKRLPSGDLHLRIYVSGPGRATYNRALHEHLPGGSLRVLTVRVREDGDVEVGFH